MESANSLVNTNPDSSLNDSSLHNESSISSLSITNVSYDSAKSTGSQKLSQNSSSNVNLLNTTEISKLKIQENFFIQQTHASSSKYNHVKFYYNLFYIFLN